MPTCPTTLATTKQIQQLSSSSFKITFMLEWSHTIIKLRLEDQTLKKTNSCLTHSINFSNRKLWPRIMALKHSWTSLQVSNSTPPTSIKWPRTSSHLLSHGALTSKWSNGTKTTLTGSKSILKMNSNSQLPTEWQLVWRTSRLRLNSSSTASTELSLKCKTARRLRKAALELHWSKKLKKTTTKNRKTVR